MTWPDVAALAVIFASIFAGFSVALWLVERLK